MANLPKDFKTKNQERSEKARYLRELADEIENQEYYLMDADITTEIPESMIDEPVCKLDRFRKTRQKGEVLIRVSFEEK